MLSVPTCSLQERHLRHSDPFIGTLTMLHSPTSKKGWHAPELRTKYMLFVLLLVAYYEFPSRSVLCTIQVHE